MLIATVGNTVKQSRTGIRFLINCITFTAVFCLSIKFFMPVTREMRINDIICSCDTNVKHENDNQQYLNNYKEYSLICGEYKIKINTDTFMLYAIGDTMLITTNATGDIFYMAKPKETRIVDINNLVSNSQYL